MNVSVFSINNDLRFTLNACLGKTFDFLQTDRQTDILLRFVQSTSSTYMCNHI